MKQITRMAMALEQRAYGEQMRERDKRADLLLAQITYLQAESTSIQNNFLAMLYIPLAFVGVMIYYAYQSPASVYLFLLLPFLFSWCIANLMKYTLKSFDIGAYIMVLEGELNNLYGGEELFRWERRYLDTNGYSNWGTFAQVPILFLVYAFLIVKFVRSAIALESWVIRIPFLAAFAVYAVLLLCLARKPWGQYQELMSEKRRLRAAEEVRINRDEKRDDIS